MTTSNAAPMRSPRPEGGRRYTPRRKVCGFCVDHTDNVDYKDLERLSRYVSERGMIEPRRKTGTCLWHQRRLAMAIKRARHLALLPYTQAHMWTTGSLVLRRGASRGAPMVAPLRTPAPQHAAAAVVEEMEAVAPVDTEQVAVAAVEVEEVAAAEAPVAEMPAAEAAATGEPAAEAEPKQS